MDQFVKKVLPILIAMVMAMSAMMALLPQSNIASSQANSSGLASPAASFNGLTQAQLKPIAENFSGISHALSQYKLTPMNPNNKISFMINFQIPDMSALNAYIQSESTPGSGNYQKALQYSDFMPGATYGVSKSLYSNTISYFEEKGFNVQTQSALGIQFSGTVNQVQKAFNTTMVTFQYNGKTMFTNNKPLNLPSFLTSSISSIDGLTNLLTYKPTLMLSPPISGGVSSSSTGGLTPTYTSAALNTYLSHSQVLNYSKHSFMYTNLGGSNYQYLFPTTMPVLYNATGLVSHGYNGKGINIAVVMCQGYNPSDLYNYAKQVYNNPMQILNRIHDITVNGATPASNSTPLNYTNGGAGEFSLDIEYSSTMAPGANIYAAYGPDLSTLSLDLVYAALASNSTHFNVITNSWGGDEDIWWNLYGPSWQNANTMTEYFAMLTGMGSSILASSGDNAGVDATTGLFAPSFPADSPYVTSVGGLRSVAQNGTNGPFPATTLHSNFTLGPYTSGYASTGLFFPNMVMNISTATGLNTESYWYSTIPGAPQSAPPFAGGQFGLSYWNSQPWWQHGPAIPNAGRLSAVDVAAEADFNMSEYFAGGWVFFWGGTSFACPTTAGLLADVLSYENATVGMNDFTGGANPYIYSIGNFAPNLTNHDPFYSVYNGSNPYVQNNLNLGWPGDMYYPNEFNTSVAFNGSSKPLPYNYLTGWGSINAYNFAIDLKQILSQTNELTGSPSFSSLNSNSTYTYSTSAPSVKFILYNNFGKITDVFTVYTSAGSISLSTKNMNNGTLIAIAGGDYYFAYVHHVIPGKGKLTIKLLTPKSIMGGFSLFNQYLSTFEKYPDVGPLMPNTAMVQVSLNGTPIANAQVLATQSKSIQPFDPVYGSPTNVRSVGFTNDTGVGFVETWNVAQNVTYYINASYQGQSANTTMYVMPQVNSNTVNKNISSIYPYDLIGLLIAPAVFPSILNSSTSYELQLNETNATGKPISGAYVTIDCEILGGNYGFVPITTPEKTSKNGLVNITITDAIPAGVLLYVAVQNGSYQSMTYNGQDLMTNVSVTPILFGISVSGDLSYVSGTTSQGIPYAGMYADQSSSITSLVVVQNTSVFFDSINGTISTGITYWFNSGPKSIAPIGYNVSIVDPQNFYEFSAPLPSDLSLGMNTFNVEYTDTAGFTYQSSTTFYYLGMHTMPTSSITATGTTQTVSGLTYYSGNVVFDLSSNLPSGFGSAVLTITNSNTGVSISQDVTGMSTASFNFATLAAGNYTVTYSVQNDYGQTNTSTVTVNTGAYTATFYEYGLSSGAKWGVNIAGKNYTTTNDSLSVTLAPGTYMYKVIGVSGYNSPASGNVSNSGNISVTYSAIPSSTTTTTVVAAGGSAGGGFAAGAAALYFIRRRKP